ncbi:MAG: hypothetical protein RJA07_679 [Bacteroidota bacterium]|jgi:hypothetical protein
MKITFFNQIYTLWFHLLGTLLIILFFVFCINFSEVAILGVFGWWLFQTIPILYLHIDYYLRNKGEEIEVNNDGIRIRNGNISKFFSKDEIKYVYVYKSKNIEKWGFPLMGLEFYYFARITMKSEAVIFITCLMGRNLESELQKLEGVFVQKKGTFFCTTRSIW